MNNFHVLALIFDFPLGCIVYALGGEGIPLYQRGGCEGIYAVADGVCKQNRM